MPNNLNQCQFIGNVTAQPEIRYNQSGDVMASLSIGVNWKGKEKEGAEFPRLTAYKGIAKIIGEYVNKGTKLYVSCKYRERKWQDKYGNNRYSTEFVIQDLEMLDGRPGGQGGQQPNNFGNQQAQKPQGQQPQQQTQSLGEPFLPDGDFSDDIPFAPIGKQYRALLNCI